MNTQTSQSIPSFVPIRKTRDNVATTTFKLSWSFGAVNDYVRHAIYIYLNARTGVLDVQFPGKTDLLNVRFDPAIVTQHDIRKCLECPQIQLKALI